MNAHTTISPLDTVRSLYRKMTMADQLAIMCDLIQTGHRDLRCSEAFSNALVPVEAAFVTAFGDLDYAAEAQ